MFFLFTGAVQTTEGLQNMPVKEGATTSEVVKFLNDIFDSMNGRREDLKKDKNELRREVTANTSHMIFWKEASNILENNFHFVDVKTRRVKNVPSSKNLRTTLIGFQRLWRDLEKLKFKNFSPRTINQDPLEIFFGMIRSHGGRIVNPTPIQFEHSFNLHSVDRGPNGPQANKNVN